MDAKRHMVKAPAPLAEPDIKPTPTQAENDLTANGVYVETHEPDGSPIDSGIHPDAPPDGGTNPPPPTVTSISPTTSQSANQQISVRGTDFTADTKIVFAGTEQTTTFRDATWLQAMVANPGVGFYDVLARGTGGDSNAMQFQFK